MAKVINLFQKDKKLKVLKVHVGCNVCGEYKQGKTKCCHQGLFPTYYHLSDGSQVKYEDLPEYLKDNNSDNDPSAA